MSQNIAAGVVQLGMAALLLYAWWSGAMSAVVDAVASGIRTAPTGRPLDLSRYAMGTGGSSLDRSPTLSPVVGGAGGGGGARYVR